MDIRALKLISMIDKKMTWLASRQDVLAQNVANADTPEYRSQDLMPLDFKRTLSQQFHRLPPVHSDPRHMSGTLPTDPRFKLDEVDENYESSPNENNVVLEEQMTKISETGVQYRAATKIYERYLYMFRTAIGRNGG